MFLQYMSHENLYEVITHSIGDIYTCYINNDVYTPDINIENLVNIITMTGRIPYVD